MSPLGRHAQGKADPWAWENARARLSSQPAWGVLELAGYTDLSEFRLSGEAASGPYGILTPTSAYDPASDQAPGLPRMGLVLRLELHLAHDPDDYLDKGWDSLDADIIPGGNGGDELTALISLALGIRLKAGGIARYFDVPDHTLGHPCEPNPPPYLPQLRAGFALLPYTGSASPIGNKVDLRGMRLLDSYPYLTLKEARTLVKSARAYQEAIWIADGDPRQAWLRLITAVETVAQLVPSQLAAPDRLKLAHPEIWNCIRGDAKLEEMLTAKLVDQSRSTVKFLGFLESFQPKAPRRRPKRVRLDWTDLSEQLRDIYRYRSKDLHEGVPFPQKLCEPYLVSPRETAPEIAAVLNDKDQMSLQIFEYVVRGALQNWCHSTAKRRRAATIAEFASSEDVHGSASP
jgi:hypothetical protein